MLTKDDTTVIIDFNSCCTEGKEGNIGGTYMWTDASYNDHHAVRENDFCGLRKIREWLRDPEPFRVHGVKDQKLHEQQEHHGQLGKDCYICR
ncbi:hypothetical protein MMC28_003543 [Mycoblastus sanguinarius]|nr:hypothetical protein [Mycoblastus sanguinarius]